MCVEFKDTYRDLRTALVQAQENRSLFEENLPSNDPSEHGTEIGWAVLEREMLVTMVNTERFKRGLPPIDMHTFISQAEIPARGHFDYTPKVVLYATELAHGTTRPR